MNPQLDTQGSANSPATEAVTQGEHTQEKITSTVSEVKEDSKPEATKVEAPQDDAEAKKKEAAAKGYKERELSRAKQLERQLAEKDEVIRKLTSEPIKEGEEYDPFLKKKIPSNMSAADYRKELVQTATLNRQQQVQNELVDRLKGQLSEIEAKDAGAKDRLAQAVNSKLIDDGVLVAASEFPHGMEILHNLCKENPEILKEISECDPIIKAVKIGSIMQKYQNKPDARVTRADAPITPVSDSVKSGADYSSMSDAEKFRAKLREYRKKYK